MKKGRAAAAASTVSSRSKSPKSRPTPTYLSLLEAGKSKKSSKKDEVASGAEKEISDVLHASQLLFNALCETCGAPGKIHAPPP